MFDFCDKSKIKGQINHEDHEGHEDDNG